MAHSCFFFLFVFLFLFSSFPTHCFTFMHVLKKETRTCISCAEHLRDTDLGYSSTNCSYLFVSDSSDTGPAQGSTSCQVYIGVVIPTLILSWSGCLLWNDANCPVDLLACVLSPSARHVVVETWLRSHSLCCAPGRAMLSSRRVRAYGRRARPRESASSVKRVSRCL